MALPPRIPESRPRHPFGRRAFATGVVLCVVAALCGVALLLADDPDMNAVGVVFLVLTVVVGGSTALLALLERAMLRRRDR